MKFLYVELEPGKQDGPAMTYSEAVDGLNPDALVMVEAKEVAKALEMLNNVINNLKIEIENAYPNFTVAQKLALLDSRFSILTSSGKPELIKADLGTADER